MVHDHDPSRDDESSFSDASINRRQFGKLAASTAAVLALPGNSTAELNDDRLTDEYQYVVNHTPAEYAAPTVVRFADESGVTSFAAIDGVDLDTETDVVELEDDLLGASHAAYAPLTAAQTESTLDIPTAEELSYTQGSNPFWRLGYYPFGVFPSTHRSADFVDYHQMVDGLGHLEASHDDRLNFFAIDDGVQYGKSPGHYNNVSDRDDPKDVYVAEVTNDVRDREAFADKRKVMFVLGMHGLERAGVEAGTRFIEELLRGNERDTESLLDDVALLFLFANPDGWVVRGPQYDSGWQLGGPGTGLPRAPAAPLHERGNAEIYDTNRQYPTPGWIDPAHFPSEPDPDRATGDRTPADVVQSVPDSLGIVEHFREYENVTHGADLHGMFWNSDFILGMINQNEYTQNEFHDLYEMNRTLEADLEEELGDWETIADAQKAATGDYNPEVLFPVLPETAYDYSTIWDAIGYTITGGLIGWMAAADEFGGLDVTTMGFEMAYSHMIGGNVYNPELIDIQDRGYKAAIRTMTEYATRDVDSSVDADGESVAYVATDSVTRSSDDLSFVESDDDTTTFDSEEFATTVDAGATESVSFQVGSGVHTLSVHPDVDDGIADAVLYGPDGEEIRADRPSETNAEGHHHLSSWTVKDPAAGEWAVEFTSLMRETDVTHTLEPELRVGTLQAQDNPDPREVLGFEQQEYEVTPLRFFDDYDASNADLSVTELAGDDVANGDHLAYDNLVVIHDDFLDDADYVAGLDDYVAGDGNLVLTDAGVRALGEMESVAEVDPEDVAIQEFGVAHVGTRNEDHPLLEDTRPIQQLLWKVAPLGYAYANEAPMSLVDADAFESAGGVAGGFTDGEVAVGSIFTDDQAWQGIHVIGGLLPPASQENLHPFGLMNHATAFFGHTVFTNALGFEQVRSVDGEEVRRFGDADSTPIEPAFDVDGSRESSASAFTGGQTNRTDLDVAVFAPAGERVIVRDHVPEGWTVDEEYGDLEATTAAPDGGTYVYFGLADPQSTYEELTQFAEAPDGLLETDTYEFGPIAVSRDVDGAADAPEDREWIEIDGTDETVTVVAMET